MRPFWRTASPVPPCNAQLRGSLATSDEAVAARGGGHALYEKRLRPLIRDARLFHISARPDGVHWDGMEYCNPARRRGVVFAFHGSDATERTHRFVLSGLEARTLYRLHFEDGTSSDSTVSGEQLMTTGVQVGLPGPLSSELVFLSAPGGSAGRIQLTEDAYDSHELDFLFADDSLPRGFGIPVPH